MVPPSRVQVALPRRKEGGSAVLRAVPGPSSVEELFPVLLCLLPSGSKGFLASLQFQSHQIFHVLVVAAAFVHFYGVSNLQEFRYGLEGGCTDDSLL